MAKRRLTRQQQNRIRHRQRLEVDEQQARSADSEAASGDGPRLTGLVISHFGQQLEVEAREGPRQGELFRCFQRSNLPPLVAGDRVVFAVGASGTGGIGSTESAVGIESAVGTGNVDGTGVIASASSAASDSTNGVITGLEDRQNVFCRPAAGGQLKPVAANIDLVMVVLAPRPQPFLNLLDRYLVAIESLGLRPLIVINKSDLIDDQPDPVIETVLADYPQLGYPVYSVSSSRSSGLEALESALRNSTAVIVGQSGVGKSSLINALSPAVAARVGELSSGAEKGTHTTTSARLFHLGGFDLIDSPGIREFGLWHISPAELLEGFVEFRPFLGHCKFRDCSHRDQPGCELIHAVEQGNVKAYRLASYFQILDSL